MKCLECGAERAYLDNEHLLECSAITLQEYGIRHRMPLDLLLHPDQINLQDDPKDYPPTRRHPGEAARSTLEGLRWAGMLRHNGDFAEIPGEIRRLDLLLWDLQRLNDYGFRYRQEYRYSQDTHRVVAHNHLRTLKDNLKRSWASPEPPPDFLDTLAVYLAHVGEVHAGYLFMPFPSRALAEEVRTRLAREHRIQCQLLDGADGPEEGLLRAQKTEDTERLLKLLADRLRAMPGAWERFTQETPEATVSKELVFDAAHFITDHPAKCSNLHGGRYVLQVEVSGRIDPVTGCVVDFGYLKRVVNRQVVNPFDHHHLNYAAVELAWRSSTEMICAYIWERLIEHLPGLSKLSLWETTQSRCDYTGPDLASFQEQGSTALLHAFDQVAAPDMRRRMLLPETDALRVVTVS